MPISRESIQVKETLSKYSKHISSHKLNTKAEPEQIPETKVEPEQIPDTKEEPE